MRTHFYSKSVTVVVVAASVCTATGYLLYLLLKKKDDEDVTVGKVIFNETTIKVPNKLVGALIGRNGSNIKAIEEETNTKLNFRNTSDTEYKLCIIIGDKDSCKSALDIIEAFISCQPKLEIEVMHVPSVYIPKLIGRCGEQITEIIIRSGAKVDISRDSSEPLRKITIAGSTEQINTAKKLIEKIVENQQTAQENLDIALAKREPRLKSPSPKSSENSQLERVVSPPTVNPQVERISPILGQNDGHFVYVSAIIDPSSFWIQIVGPKAAQLDQLVEKMTEFYGNEEIRQSHICESFQVGDRVAAVFDFDKKWYRAEVISIPESGTEEPLVELFYLDYGDFSYVPKSEICSLPTNFLELNFQAVECSLARVEPLEGEWNVEAIDRFEETVYVARWRKLLARLYNCSERTRPDGSPIPGISLYDVDKDQDIAQDLVDNGFAVFKE